MTGSHKNETRLVTVAVFDQAFDVRFNLLKDMLDQAGIRYITTHQNWRSIRASPLRNPANVAIEIRVTEDRLDEAQEIWESIR